MPRAAGTAVAPSPSHACRCKQVQLHCPGLPLPAAGLAAGVHTTASLSTRQSACAALSCVAPDMLTAPCRRPTLMTCSSTTAAEGAHSPTCRLPCSSSGLCRGHRQAAATTWRRRAMTTEGMPGVGGTTLMKRCAPQIAVHRPAHHAQVPVVS